MFFEVMTQVQQVKGDRQNISDGSFGSFDSTRNVLLHCGNKEYLLRAISIADNLTGYDLRRR